MVDPRPTSPAERRITRGVLAAALLATASLGAMQADAQRRTSVASIRPLIGSWRVVGVRVAPSPVQAVTPNDPSLMGATLDVTARRLSWRHRKDATSLDVTCDGPRLSRARVSCARGQFGPPGATLTRSGNRLTIGWYDGATLLLARKHRPS